MYTPSVVKFVTNIMAVPSQVQFTHLNTDHYSFYTKREFEVSYTCNKKLFETLLLNHR
jgi:hypothetical protein